MNQKQLLPQLTDRFQLPIPEKYGACVEQPCAYISVMFPVIYELHPLSEQHVEPRDLVSIPGKMTENLVEDYCQ